MQCLHPICGVVPSNGGRIKLLPQTDYPRGNYPPFGRCVYVPCGKCLPCRINRRRELTCLQALEAKQASRSNWFLTLTYDDVRYFEYTGDVPYSLVKDHLRDFCFSLRHHFKHLGRNFRYFACGEYGEIGERPHYHLSLFDLDEFDLQLPTKVSIKDRDRALNLGKLNTFCDYHLDENGNPVFRSKLIEKFWPFGNYKLCLASTDTFQYVAGYVIKKLSGDKLKDFKALGLTPEFLYQSRPSIGYTWWLNNWQHIFNPESTVRIVNTSIEIDGHIFPIPRIFWKWFETLDADARSIKDRLLKIFQKDLPLVPDRGDLARKKRKVDHEVSQFSVPSRGLKGINQ